MAQVLTNAEKIRRLPWNTALNATNSVFAQLIYFGPAFVLFLSELNFTNTQIGFLLSLMPFMGLIALVVAPAVARFGYKRTWLLFFGLRNVISVGLLLVPFVMAQFTQSALLIYVTFIVGGFALFRAIAETAMYPWAQEFIPNTIRGRYSAINDIMARLTGIGSLALGSYVLGLSIGLDRFMLMFAIGLVFGYVSVWTSTFIPGGAPAKESNAAKMSYRQLAHVLRDKNFLIYMAGLSALIIGSTPMGSFLPLYMEQQVGLSESNTVLLQIGTLVGGLTSVYLVGWAADRYGSKPVMLSGLYVKVLLPIAWLLMPRNSPMSLPAALIIAMVNGTSDIAWAIGSGRLLYVRVVPVEKRAEYMAVYYAMIGLIGGLSQIIGGRVLDVTQHLSGQFLIFTIDPFFPLFVFGFILTVISVVLFNRVQADSPVSLSEFAGLFVHGNPVMGLESLFRYYRARDERQTIAMTERMGKTKSPLTVDELLEALKDPRFNVRFEAIISIARMESDPRLVEALCNIVEGTELSLSVIAAWALGRMGDASAIESLQHGLASQYRSVQAHCARALGTLGDKSVAPMLLERLKTETDKGLRVAYASALGNLGISEAVPTLLDVLQNTDNEGARLEIALSLARIVGHEHQFIRLLRQIRSDRGTAVSQALTLVKRHVKRKGDEVAKLILECADTFAREDVDAGIGLLNRLIQLMLPEIESPVHKTVLEACVAQLETSKSTRPDYLMLALHTLHIAVL